MTHFCKTHRVPFADREPFDEAAARRLFECVLAVQQRPETVVILLDQHRRGRSIFNVDGTDHPDAVLAVAEWSIDLAGRSPGVGGAIVASVRPHGGDDLDDVERWLDLDERFERAGIELIEWYVVGRSVSRPRTLIGEPDRWAT
jgi:hypothetical protein